MSTEPTTMNEANQITAQTSLYGFIAEHAQSDRYSVTLNRLFKSQGDDAMMLPMNIRTDDLYFTVSNLRKAQLKGVALGPEYRHEVLEVLDERDAEVNACGLCDIVHVKQGRLVGEIAIGSAVNKLLKEAGVRSLAILGSGGLAKSILMHISESDVEDVTLFNDHVESCLALTQSLQGQVDIRFDIERVIEGRSSDLSQFDAAFNASPLKGPGEIALEASPLMIDLERHLSLFRNVATKAYMGYDDVLPYLTQSAYDIWKKEDR